jgi:tRNA(fMet)-specific endonuclease VapC
MRYREATATGPVRVDSLERAIARYVYVPVDHETCRPWGGLRARRAVVGAPIAPQDAWIAAAAVRLRVPLVTHNPSDYVGIDGLDVLSAA